jgi:hypothetical protein
MLTKHVMRAVLLWLQRRELLCALQAVVWVRSTNSIRTSSTLATHRGAHTPLTATLPSPHLPLPGPLPAHELRQRTQSHHKGWTATTIIFLLLTKRVVVGWLRISCPIHAPSRPLSTATAVGTHTL